MYTKFESIEVKTPLDIYLKNLRYRRTVGTAVGTVGTVGSLQRKCRKYDSEGPGCGGIPGPTPSGCNGMGEFGASDSPCLCGDSEVRSYTVTP